MQPDSKFSGRKHVKIDPERADFFRAVHDGDMTFLEIFLARHPQAAKWQTPDGTPMMVLAVGSHERDLYAVNTMYRQKEVMALLLSYGADVNAKDALGRTALIEECYSNHNEEVIDLLIMTGAEVNAADNLKTTSLHLLARNDWDEHLIKKLAAAGAKLDVQDWLGNTPLHVAAGERGLEFMAGNQNTVRVLINMGASLEIKNTNMRTPFDSACMNGDFVEDGKRPTADIIEAVLKTRPKPKLPRIPRPADKSPGTGSTTPDPRLPHPKKDKFKIKSAKPDKGPKI